MILAPRGAAHETEIGVLGAELSIKVVHSLPSLPFASAPEFFVARSATPAFKICFYGSTAVAECRPLFQTAFCRECLIWIGILL